MNLMLAIVLSQAGGGGSTQDPAQAEALELRPLIEVVQRTTLRNFRMALPATHRGPRCSTDFLREIVRREPKNETAVEKADRILAGFQAALAGAGFGAIRDEKDADCYTIIMLGQGMPVTPPDYTDAEKLPTREEICTLTLKPRRLTPQGALTMVRQRLHPLLVHLCIATNDSLSLVDFAPRLRQVARLIAQADEAEGEAMRAVEVEFWLLEEGGADAKAPPAEVAALGKDLKKPHVAGHGRARVSPKGPGQPGAGEIALLADAELSVGFSALNDRGTLKLTDVRATDNKSTTHYRSASVLLKPGAPVALSSWSRYTLVVRATIGE